MILRHIKRQDCLLTWTCGLTRLASHGSHCSLSFTHLKKSHCSLPPAAAIKGLPHNDWLCVFFLSLMSSSSLISRMVIWVVLASVIGFVGGHASNFDHLFRPSWANDHVVSQDGLIKLRLDSSSGAGFVSKNKYLFGKATAEIKLVPDDSAGTVTAYYMSSEGPNHHEFDFEFLGNTTGNPYSVQTNVYVNGVGNREQRMDLWFDPTADFHSYSILWNQKHVVFLVDETPIRVNRNKESKGVPFPNDQAMGVYSSIWNADDWATQGGRVKTDWSHEPFVTTFRDFQVDGCVVSANPTTEEMSNCSSGGAGNNDGGHRNGSGGFWWKQPTMEELSVHQTHQLKWVRAKHLIYDYCSDKARFPVLPPDCIR